MQLDYVRAVEVIFVTAGRDDVLALRETAAEIGAIIGAMNKMAEEMSFDCDACEYAGLIFNRVSGDAKQDGLRVPSDIPYLGTIPEDEVIRLADAAGKSLIDIADCKASEALRACLEKL